MFFELEILPKSKRFKKLEEPVSKPCLENLKKKGGGGDYKVPKTKTWGSLTNEEPQPLKH